MFLADPGKARGCSTNTVTEYHCSSPAFTAQVLEWTMLHRLRTFLILKEFKIASLKSYNSFAGLGGFCLFEVASGRAFYQRGYPV